MASVELEASLEQMRIDRNGLTLDEMGAAHAVLERQSCVFCHRSMWGTMVVFGNGTAGHHWCEDASSAQAHARLMLEIGPPSSRSGKDTS